MTLGNVKVLQTKLAVKGFYTAALDGIAGPKTWQGVASFTLGHAAPAYTGEMIATYLDTSTRLRVIYALANISAESKFAVTEENLNYSAERLCEVWPHRFSNPVIAKACANNPAGLANIVYGGRMGNCQPGDGYKFRGRYWPQLTGADAYRAAQEKTGKPYFDNPNVMMTPVGCAIAARFVWDWKNIGPLADADNPLNVRRAWNGGLIGADEVCAIVQHLKDIWPAS